MNATIVLVCLVAAFIASSIGAARTRDALYVVSAIALAVALVLMFVHWRAP